MKIRLLLAAANIGSMFPLVVGFAAEAAEIKVLSALAMKPVMEDLGPKFERATGHKLTITFATVGEAVKRVQGGETADVAILPRQGIDIFVKDGKTAAGSVTGVASSGNGVAIRKGSPKPDISSPEVLKRTLLAAKSITYTPLTFGGTSGPHIVKVFERLGIADEMQSKTIFRLVERPELVVGIRCRRKVANMCGKCLTEQLFGCRVSFVQNSNRVIPLRSSNAGAGCGGAMDGRASLSHPFRMVNTNFPRI